MGVLMTYPTGGDPVSLFSALEVALTQMAAAKADLVDSGSETAIARYDNACEAALAAYAELAQSVALDDVRQTLNVIYGGRP